MQDEADFNAFIEQAVEKLKPVSRQIADDAYEAMLINLETYLVSNADFNIGARIASAEADAAALRAKLAAAEERADRNAAAVDAQARAIAEAVEAERAAIERFVRDIAQCCENLDAPTAAEAMRTAADAIAARKGGPK